MGGHQPAHRGGPANVDRRHARPIPIPEAPFSHKEKRNQMALQIGASAPDFEAETTEGPIHFDDWIGDSWAVLFSHPSESPSLLSTSL